MLHWLGKLPHTTTHRESPLVRLILMQRPLCTVSSRSRERPFTVWYMQGTFPSHTHTSHLLIGASHGVQHLSCLQCLTLTTGSVTLR